MMCIEKINLETHNSCYISIILIFRFLLYFSNLKAIVAEDMGHLEHIEIVSALLEDYNPNIEVIGIDYQAKTEQLRLEAEELEMKAKEIEENRQVIHSLPEPAVGEDKKVRSKIESVPT